MGAAEKMKIKNTVAKIDEYPARNYKEYVGTSVPSEHSRRVVTVVGRRKVCEMGSVEDVRVLLKTS